MKQIKFISKYAKGFRHQLIIMFMSTFVYVGIILVYPILLRYTIDNVINGLPVSSGWFSFFDVVYLRSHLWILALVFIGLSGFSSVALFLRGQSMGMFAESFSENLRNSVYDHLQKLPFSYHVQSTTGDLIQRCTSDVDQIGRFLSNQVRELTYALLLVFISLGVMFSINVKMTFISMITFPIIFIFAVKFFKNMQKTFKQYDEEEAALFSVFKESLDGVRVVKAFNRERFELAKFDQKNKDLTNTSRKMFKLLGMYWGVSDFFCLAQIMIVLIASIFEVRNGAMTVGSAMLFVSYISTVLWPIRNVGRILSDLGKVGVSVDRLNEIFDEPMENLECGLKPEISGSLVFKDVSFEYDDGHEPVLSNLSFSIEKGSTVAIMGPTGSGKSSLVYLLTRLYDPSSGTILLDGVDITEISRAYLREKVGIVLQEPYLFSKSIFENIKLSNPNSSKQDVYNAARIASIHDVIEGFDMGYETLVGEKGVTLSGGQKQRVAIARTIIKDHPLVIFDDSLSALDSETDAKIRSELKNLKTGSTSIIITHRINSAMGADKIVVIDKGRIVEVGTHESLMLNKGLYARIDAIQNNKIGEVLA